MSPRDGYRTSRSTLDGPRRQAGRDVALDDEEEDHHRKRGDDRTGHERSPGGTAAGLVLQQPGHQILLLRAVQGIDDDELVPRLDEAVDRRGHQPGTGERQDDPPEDLSPAASVDQGRLVEFAWDGGDETAQ